MYSRSNFKRELASCVLLLFVFLSLSCSDDKGHSNARQSNEDITENVDHVLESTSDGGSDHDMRGEDQKMSGDTMDILQNNEPGTVLDVKEVERIEANSTTEKIDIQSNQCESFIVMYKEILGDHDPNDLKSTMVKLGSLRKQEGYNKCGQMREYEEAFAQLDEQLDTLFE